MSIGLRLDLRQTQQLVMTPQLQQAIKLLQMSHSELSGFIDSEIEKNPLLKLEVSTPDAPDGPGEAAAGTLDASAPSDALPEMTPETLATDSGADDVGLMTATYDTGTENLHDTSPSDGPDPFQRTAPGVGSASGDSEGRTLEERLVNRQGLREHLHAQLGQISAPAAELLLAGMMVDDLDEHGYLRTELAVFADRVAADPDTTHAALSLLQSCEPTGVGARSLGECLALQLREQNRFDPVIAMLLDNLDLVAKGELRKLKRICDVGESELIEMIQEIRHLNPRPCADFDVSDPETVIPDLLLRATEFGGWMVELNPETLPRVLIDQSYAAEVGKGCVETRNYLTECHASANWLVRSLDQRARTIVKIASEVVRQQESFFREGIQGLRPMNLKDVAEAVGMHESTASRVTSNKYIETDRGIFELKFFFSNGIGSSQGSDVAAEAVRHRIRAMVDGEASDAILSDDAIVAALSRDGIQIARRTVAKYRKSLNIASSSQRRRQKAANG
ncbi:MAG: RNA polymerase factor sigma-54 [Pseudomonadota bacterium]